ncbi:MAG TPA: protein kinase, partial [Burkholderiaceae bacterium]|nr:protein kinase [Burkholderiaceae bacterium]
VAIKEYMPATLAARTHGSLVMPRTDKSTETFALGLRSFVNEAQLLASFDHPSLLKVYRFWEANGTAYMVMPYYQGTTLKKALNALDAPPEEGWLRRQLGQLLDALDVMHGGHCYHRDIAPDNILLLDNGTPLLLDFGAARRVIGDATHALTAFLKPGYAPVEQYAEMPTMKQGPWTDLYALGSVVHYAITGRTPPESVARLVNDTMVPLATVAAGRYSDRFLRAIDHALAVRPEARPQSAIELRDEIGLEERRARTRKADRIPTAPQPLDETVIVRAESTVAPRPSVPSVPKSAPPSTPPRSVPPRSRLGVPPQATAQPIRRRGRAWLLVAAVALVGAVGLAWWSLPAPRSDSPAGEARPREEPLPVPANEGHGDAPATATTSPDVAPAATATLVPEPAITSSPAAAPTTEPAVAEPPTTPRPAAAARPAPKKNSPNPRCTEIITRASLGEELSAQDQAMLKGECRK